MLSSLRIKKKVKGITSTRSGTSGKDDSLDRFVPTLDGLIEGRHEMSGVFTPSVGDKCKRPEELANRPSSIYIPFGFWMMMVKTSEETQGISGTVKIGELPIKGHISASNLAKHLAATIDYIKKEDAGRGTPWAKRFKVAGQVFLEFLWAAHNHLAYPVEMFPAGHDVKSLLRHSRCLHMLSQAYEGRFATISSGGHTTGELEDERGTNDGGEDYKAETMYRTPENRPRDPSAGRLRKAHLTEWRNEGGMYHRTEDPSVDEESQEDEQIEARATSGQAKARDLGDVHGRTSARAKRTGDAMDSEDSDSSGEFPQNPRPTKKGRRGSSSAGGSSSKMNHEEAGGGRGSTYHAATTQGHKKLPPMPKGRAIPPAGPAPSKGQFEQNASGDQGAEASMRHEIDDMKTAIITLAQNNSAFLTVAKEIGESNKSSRERDNKKDYQKKPISRWVGPGAAVLKILSAKDGWDTVPPEEHELTMEAEQIFDQLPTQAIELLRSAAIIRNWPGGILRVGLSQFIRRGLMNKRLHARPESFSVLFFHPADEEEEDNPDFELQQTRETFNEKRELSEQVIKAVSKNKIYIPETTYHASDMILSAVGFLRYVCGPNTIATSGYQEGWDLINQNRGVFERASRANPQFLLNYLCLLDREFQNFLKEVASVADSPTPIRALISRGKQTMMEDSIYSLLSPWLEHGMAFSFRAPEELKGMVRSSSSKKGFREIGSKTAGASETGGTTNPSGGKGKVTMNLGSSHRTGGSGSANDGPSWWHQLPESERIDEWKVPTGRRFGDFFNSAKSENTRGMPKVSHHRTGRKTNVCLKHQLETCGKGAHCNFAHVLAKTLPADTRQAITEKLKGVYNKGGDS